MRGIIRVLALVMALPALASGQGLFEEATEQASGLMRGFDLGGYLRSVLYLGRSRAPVLDDIKSAFGELSLQFKISKPEFGGAYAEFRTRRGREFGRDVSQFDLREAYVDVFAGPFDFRLGHQIVAWGKADGINPTDNITPKDMLARSPDEDDRRLANFLLRSTLNLYPTRLEVIWIPFYRSSRIPTDFIQFPSGVVYSGSEYPGARMEHSGFALKLHFEQPSLDGSLSYFNGYNPQPGVAVAEIEIFPVPIFLKAYRMHVVGVDFSTTLAGKWGLRGEAAYRSPHDDPLRNIHVINPDLQVVIGIDREFSGNVSFILQYLGRYVIDFATVSPLFGSYYDLELKNRLLSSQQFRWSHAVSCRAALSLWHQTLDMEMVAYANMTSEEFFLKPRLTYAIADALSFVIGGEFYQGPQDTLFDLVNDQLSSGFLELRLSF